MTEAASKATNELLALRAGGKLYALRVAQVVEVLRPPPTAELPRVPNYLRGATQFRAEIIPVIDLAGRLGLVVDSSGATPLKARLVVVRSTRGRAGLLVEEIIGVWRDGVIEGEEARRGDQRLPLVDVERAVDWRAG